MNIKEHSKNIRLNILRLANKSQKVGSHISPSLSVVEILSVLFNKIFDVNIDKFILSKGHAGLAMYSAMYDAGVIDKSQLDTFEDNGGEFPGQPTKTKNNHVEFASGSLGLGLSYACGLASAKKMHNEKGTIYVLVGDGEMNEGTNYESLMFIKHHQLDNICIIIDNNNMQSDGNTNNILNVNLNKICNGFGFNVINSSGHDEKKLLDAFTDAKNKCSVIIANTVKGKGISFMESNNEWHHNSLKDDMYLVAKNEVDNA